MASCEDLRGAVAELFSDVVSVFVERELLLVIAQLGSRHSRRVAATHARRIELANHFEGFLEIGGREVWTCRLDVRRGAGAGATAAAESPLREAMEASAGELGGQARVIQLRQQNSRQHQT